MEVNKLESQALRKMVSRIFSDEQTKEAFMNDPESVVTGYSLTEPEKKAVMAIHARLGLVTDSTQIESEDEPLVTWV